MEQTAQIQERPERRLEDLEPVGCGVGLHSTLVSLGITGDDGEETYEAVPCRRCGQGIGK
jgi:hypothetical protein